MIKTKVSGAVFLAASLGASSVLAETEEAFIKLGGGVNFTPSVNLDVLYDDNVTSAETDEIESWVTVFTPGFLLSAENDKSAYTLGYSLTRGEYHDSEEDNYTDHEVTADAAWALTARHKLAVSGTYLDGHESRGTGFSQGGGAAITAPDEFQDTDIQVRYGFGAESAKGHLDVELGTRERDFEGDARTEARDRSTDYAGVTFRYNVGARTEVLAQVNHRDISYDVTPLGDASLNSTETDYLVGVTWEGTAKTTGSVKVGSSEKKFDDNSRSDFTGPRWEVGVRWAPRSYSSFDFTTSSRSDETNGTGDFIDVASYSVAWNHEWADRLSSTLSYEYAEDDYEGDSDSRKEETNTTGLRVDYQMRRWLNLNAGVTYTDKDSTEAGSDYDRAVFAVGIQATL